MVMLKNVKVGFSKFNDGSRFEPGSDLRYTGSVVLEEGSDNYKLVRLEIMTELRDGGVSRKRAEEIFKTKMKEDEKYAENQDDVDPELCRFFWAGSTSKPLITRKQDGRVIKSKDKDDVNTYGESVFQVWGGDTVNLLVKVKYFPRYSKLAVWPQHIHIVKDSGDKEGISEYYDDMTEGDILDEGKKKESPNEGDFDDFEEENPKKPVRRRTKPSHRVKKESSNEGDFDDLEEETPKKPVRRRKRRSVGKSMSEEDKTVSETTTEEDYQWKE